MERLRTLYATAANEKGQTYKLSDPVKDDLVVTQDDGDEVRFKRRPCPIAAPIGDLRKILEDDVFGVQTHQPWLVAPEARVPRSLSQKDDKHAPAPTKLSESQKEISARLKRELSRSLKNPSNAVQKIRQQTRQLPAFEMREQILSTIQANQVTLISASTGETRCWV